MLAQAYRGLPLLDVWTIIERPITEEDHNYNQHWLKGPNIVHLRFTRVAILVGLKHTDLSEDVEI